MKNKRIPTAILGLFDLNSRIPEGLSTFLNTPVHVNSALNPIFLFFYNSLIKNGFRVFLTKILKL